MTFPDSTQRLDRLLGYLAHDPTNPSLLTTALQVASEAGDGERLAVLLAHLEKYALQEPVLCAHACLAALQLGQYALAAQWGEQALAGGIDDTALRFNTAFAQFYLGDMARTEALLVTAQPLESYALDYLLLKARALHHLDHTEEAIALLRPVAAAHPEQAEVLGLLALLLQEEQQEDAAYALAQQALALAPEQPDALLALADYHFDRSEFALADEVYTCLTTLNPQHGRAWSGLGHIAFADLDFAQAEALLLQAVQHMPNHIGTWHTLAWIAILQNQPELARERLMRAYALDRTFGDTHGGLAVVDVMQGKDAEARVGIRKALKLMPQGMAARYAELLLLEKAGDQAAARQLVESVFNQPAARGNVLRKALVQAKWQSLQERLPANTSKITAKTTLH